ncbi:hypothetical protein PCL_01271 [Purpureocillium lilacinum]|uniref:Uncharacterized protein n=1 Tax=Purpureocillium lilacinum TaxID=33203 RepID=A0A2U3E321_PURLI|nr:hypothetical protein PCL_01271 [Purpureocillium lilacinum]
MRMSKTRIDTRPGSTAGPPPANEHEEVPPCRAAAPRNNLEQEHLPGHSQHLDSSSSPPAPAPVLASRCEDKLEPAPTPPIGLGLVAALFPAAVVA